MNIALYHNLPSGGARRAVVEMVTGLVARGHTVDEYCPETADRTFLPLDGVVRRTVVLPFRPRGVARTRMPLLTPYVTAARLTLDLRAMAALGAEAARRIDRQGYDVVFSHDCQLVLVPDVLRFLRQPSVHFCHAATTASARTAGQDPSGVGPMQQVKRLYYAPARQAYPRLRFRQAGHNLRAARRVLTNSRFAAAELRDAFGVTAHVCTLGVDRAIFRPLGLPRERFVLSVGAVHPHKGYRFLLHSLGRLPREARPPLAIVANSAEPAELDALRGLAAEVGVELTVRNVADAAEMAALYNRAAAFVYAPLAEPWGLAAVEAMACAAPLVAVAEGGVAESVVDGESGLLTPRDTGTFAAALSRVLADPALASRLGASGVERTHTCFTWEQTVDRLEAHFAQVVQGGAAP